MFAYQAEQIRSAREEVAADFGEPCADYGNDLFLLRLLADRGFAPRHIYDVGGSSGIWSAVMQRVFPQAKFEVFEPLAELAVDYSNTRREHPAIRSLFQSGRASIHAVALGRDTGTCRMTVYPDGVGSTSIPLDYAPPEARLVDVPVWKLDEYIAANRLQPPDLIKIDTQGAELDILGGCVGSLRHAAAVIAECWLFRGYGSNTPLWIEVANFLRGYDFHLFDFGWTYRRPSDQRTATEDMLFLRRGVHFSPLHGMPDNGLDTLGAPLGSGGDSRQEVRACANQEKNPTTKDPKCPPAQPLINYPELNLRLQQSRRWLQMQLANCADISVVNQTAAGLRPPTAGKGKTLLVTANEVNFHHGTGVLLNRLFKPDSAFVLRSRDDYPDKGSIPSSVIPADGRTRPEVFSLVMAALEGMSIKRILCVPYYPEDFLVAVAAKSILGVPLATWVMDDNHIHTGAVPMGAASELFRVSDVCFAISAELRDAYQCRFDYKFHVLPPTISGSLAYAKPRPSPATQPGEQACAMVGNIWGADWLRRLLPILRESGWRVDWFGQGSACGWLKTTPDELKAHGIHEQGFVSEDILAERLAAYPFVIVPTGTGDQTDDRKQLTMLSLPTRLPYLMALQAPVLVIGSPESCAARFVRRFGVGLSCPYEPDALREALAKMGGAEFIAECRRNAAALAASFSDRGLCEWIWQSCEKGAPADDRFERPFQREKGSLVPFIEDPVPKDIHGDFKGIYTAMRRIARTRYKPDFIVDVGASTGVWSDTVRRLFPGTRSILVEPLPDRYSNWYYQKNPGFELVSAAASNHEGKTTFQVSSDLYGSSLLSPQDGRTYEPTEVTVTTLDSIGRKKKIAGRGILKIDVQFAEHLVLEGAPELLQQVDFLVLELTIKRAAPGARTFLEMVNDLESRGFHYLDDIGGWRSPLTGALEQKDIVFASAAIMKKLNL